MALCSERSLDTCRFFRGPRVSQITTTLRATVSPSAESLKRGTPNSKTKAAFLHAWVAKSMKSDMIRLQGEEVEPVGNASSDLHTFELLVSLRVVRLEAQATRMGRQVCGSFTKKEFVTRDEACLDVLFFFMEAERTRVNGPARSFNLLQPSNQGYLVSTPRKELKSSDITSTICK